MRPSRWASSCREPNVPEIWIATDASGRSTAKLATFETASKRIEPALNCVNNSSRRLCRVVPVKRRTVEIIRQFAELLYVHSDDQGLRIRVIRKNLAHHVFFERIFRGDAKLVAGDPHRVVHTHRPRHRAAHFVALG